MTKSPVDNLRRALLVSVPLKEIGYEIREAGCIQPSFCSSHNGINMKVRITLFAALLFGAVLGKAEIKFDGTVYSLGWETETNHVTIREFYTRGETTNTWKTMLTIQVHPDATKVKQVSGPYFEARKSLVALPPKAHTKKKGDSSDAIIELLLGAPGKTTHLEFALVRFIETDSGVYVVAYSNRIPLSSTKNQDVNVNVFMKNREKWTQELFEIPIDSVKKGF